MTKDEALDLALEALEKLTDTEQTYEALDLGDKAITAIKQARALDKKADNAMIYKTFEQWMNGDFLEVGEPRKKAYSKDELLLVEMGWNYGYDAGRAVEQALDKKADNARELGLDYEPDAYGYAKRLAEAIWKKHYQSTAPQWEPFDHLIGVLTQIDNMTSGLTTPPAASVQQEPVGRVVSANCEYATVQWLRQTSEVGGGDPKNSRSWPIAGDAVYTTPPAAQAAPVPLTDDQIRALTPKPDGVAEADVRRVEVLPGVMGTEFDEVDAWSMPLVLQIARAIEAAHGITEKGQP